MPIESVDPRELSRKLLLLSDLSSPAMALAIPKYNPRLFLDEFKSAFDARSEHPLGIAECAQPKIENLFDALQSVHQFTACYGFDEWPDIEFQRLDANRSALLSLKVLIFVFLESTLDRFLANCPHISSIVGAAVYSVEPQSLEFSEVEKERKRATLRQKFGLSDEEFLAQVQAGRYSGDPYANEWLILLNRGDLIHAPVG